MAEPGPEPKSPDQEPHVPLSPHSRNGEEVLGHGADGVGLASSQPPPGSHLTAYQLHHLRKAPDLFFICKMKIILSTFPIRLKDSQTIPALQILGTVPSKYWGLSHYGWEKHFSRITIPCAGPSARPTLWASLPTLTYTSQGREETHQSALGAVLWGRLSALHEALQRRFPFYL